MTIKAVLHKYRILRMRLAEKKILRCMSR